MLLQTAKIWYNENGAFVEIQDLISLDVTYTKVTSRNETSRLGSFTNETIDSIEINFKRGSNPLLDSLKPGHDTQLPIKFLNGAISVQGPFVVTSKTTTRQFNGDKNTFMRLKPYEDGEFIIAARGGEGGHVDDVEVDGISVVSGGVAEIQLTPYAKKTDIEKDYAKKTDLDEKLNKYTASGTDQVYVAMRDGTQSNITVTTNDAGNVIVRRLASANIVVPATPGDSNHATSKGYVDGKISTISTQLSNKVDKDVSSANFKLGVDDNGVYYEKV